MVVLVVGCEDMYRVRAWNVMVYVLTQVDDGGLVR